MCVCGDGYMDFRKLLSFLTPLQRGPKERTYDHTLDQGGALKTFYQAKQEEQLTNPKFLQFQEDAYMHYNAAV